MQTDLRRQKKLDTRRALVQGAMTLAERDGYDGFTIADVTESVGVSRRTFSNYFGGKAECLAAVSDSWIELALEKVAAAPPEMPLTLLLRDVLADLTTHLAGRRDFLSLINSEPDLQAAMALRDVDHAASVAEVIAARTGLPVTDLRVTLIAEYSMLAGRSCTERWVMAGGAGGAEALARDLDLAFSIIDFDSLDRPCPSW